MSLIHILEKQLCIDFTTDTTGPQDESVVVSYDQGEIRERLLSVTHLDFSSYTDAAKAWAVATAEGVPSQLVSMGEGRFRLMCFELLSEVF